VAALPALAEPPFPEPSGRINDFAKVLDTSARARLQELVDALQRNTGAELTLVTVFHAGQRTPEQLAEALFEHWGVSKRDKGLLLLLALNERRLEVKVGGGLQIVLPDTVAADVRLLWAGPLLRQGKIQQALLAAVSEIAKRIRKGREEGVVAAEEPAPDSAEADSAEASEVPGDPESGPTTGLARSLPGFSWVLILAATLAGLGFQVWYRLQERMPDPAFLGAGLGAALLPAILYGLGTVSGWAWLFSAGLALGTAGLGLSLWNRRCPKCELWMDITSEPVGSAAFGFGRSSRKVYDCRFCGHQYVKLSKMPTLRRSGRASPRPEKKEFHFSLSPEGSSGPRASDGSGSSRFGGRPGGGRGPGGASG
jgi:uncharacterized membrane protein YgcG